MPIGRIHRSLGYRRVRPGVQPLCCASTETKRGFGEETKFLDELAKRGWPLRSSIRAESESGGRNLRSWADVTPIRLSVWRKISRTTRFWLGNRSWACAVTDVVVAVRKLIDWIKPDRSALWHAARRDAALMACFAAAVEPAIERVADRGHDPEFPGSFVGDVGSD